jgi:nucleoside triphosphatase
MKQRIIVSCLIKKDDHFLFIRQNKQGGAYPNTYHVPGGGIDVGEDIDKAVRREILEETNIEITNLAPSHFDADIIMDYKGEPHHLIFLQYVADYKSGTPTPGSDATEIVWVDRRDLSKAPLNQPTIKWLKALRLLD